MLISKQERRLPVERAVVWACFLGMFVVMALFAVPSLVPEPAQGFFEYSWFLPIRGER
jgi:hypothetical protein